MSSAGAGRVMAQWIAGGEAPMDLWDMDIARFDRAANAGPYLAARVTEAVGEVFQMHWPCRQPSAGRGVRRSALHDAFAAAGAVFGAPGGVGATLVVRPGRVAVPHPLQLRRAAPVARGGARGGGGPRRGRAVGAHPLYQDRRAGTGCAHGKHRAMRSKAKSKTATWSRSGTRSRR